VGCVLDVCVCHLHASDATCGLQLSDAKLASKADRSQAEAAVSAAEAVERRLAELEEAMVSAKPQVGTINRSSI
jgi:hypothetical protein